MCIKANEHFAATEPVENIVGAGFNLRQGLFDEQRGDAIFAEGGFELFVLPAAFCEAFAFGFKFFAAQAQIVQHKHILLRCAYFHAQAILLFLQIKQG